jgi:Na+-driven multidrug efflux pump
MIVLLIIVAILFIPLVIYPDPIVYLFILDGVQNQSELFEASRKTGIWVWLYILLDGTVWVMAGILTAHSDTKFIMIANAVAAWCLAVVPTYIFVNIFSMAPHYSWVIVNLYAFINALIFIWRVRYIRHL